VRTVAIIQARMASTRLPGKVLRLLAGEPMLAHVARRVAACPRLDEVVVATTDRPADDAVAAEAARVGVRPFRGSEDDVLDRYYHAAQDADVVVRVTADCPLFDPVLLRAMLDRFVARRRDGLPVDYLSNTVVRTYPLGLDAEIFTFAALARAHREAREPFEREHVTPYIYLHLDRFTVEHFVAEQDHSHLRWTVDTEEDFRFVEEVYRALYRPGVIFPTETVLALLRDRPHLAAINAHVPQRPLQGPVHG